MIARLSSSCQRPDRACTHQADRRVNDIATRARDDINRARRSAVLIAFAAAVAALPGAAVAWAAACAGGRDRDGTTPRTVLSEWWHRPFRRAPERRPS